jgi:hypothetical protein
MRTSDLKLGMAVTLVQGNVKYQAEVVKFQRVMVNGKLVDRVKVRRVKSGRTELVRGNSLLPIAEFWRAEEAKKRYADDLKHVEHQRRRLGDVCKTGALFASEQGGMLRLDIPVIHAERVVDLLLRELHGT